MKLRENDRVRVRERERERMTETETEKKKKRREGHFERRNFREGIEGEGFVRFHSRDR